MGGVSPKRKSKMSRFATLPKWEGVCKKYKIKMSTHRIGYFNAVIEGYDGLARVRTDCAKEGILSILVPEDMDVLFQELLKSLMEKDEVKLLDDPTDDNIG